MQQKGARKKLNLKLTLKYKRPKKKKKQKKINCKRPRIAKLLLKNKVGNFALSNAKTYYKVIKIQAVVWGKLNREFKNKSFCI